MHLLPQRLQTQTKTSSEQCARAEAMRKRVRIHVGETPGNDDSVTFSPHSSRRSIQLARRPVVPLIQTVLEARGPASVEAALDSEGTKRPKPSGGQTAYAR
eukprot:1798350-Pleurochrysis_carterae.AAC.3